MSRSFPTWTGALLAFVLFACGESHRGACEVGDTRACKAGGGGAQRDAGSEDVQDAGAIDATVGTAGRSADPDIMDAGPAPDAAPDASFEICGTPVDIADYLQAGHEFVFDVGTQSFSPNFNTWELMPVNFLEKISDRFPWVVRPAGCDDGFSCIDREAYRELIFEESDTASSVLLGFPYQLGANGTGGSALVNNEELRDIQNFVNEQLEDDRVLLAPAVMPNDRIERQLHAMDRWAPVAAAWVTWTSWSPATDGGYYFLDDAVGVEMIEHGIALGVPTFIVSKGEPFAGVSSPYNDPKDVGPVAAAYPEARFLIQHSAFEYGRTADETSEPDGTDHGWGAEFGHWPEGPYDESDTVVQELYPLDRGVNSLIHSLRTSGVGPNENVYAVLDIVWAHLMSRPIEAAHVLGKLLLYVGEDNVLWGTDSVFHGGPAPQIEAFRDFQIPADLRAQYGYPELTPELKAKILGLNAARVFCVLP